MVQTKAFSYFWQYKINKKTGLYDCYMSDTILKIDDNRLDFAQVKDMLAKNLQLSLTKHAE